MCQEPAVGADEKKDAEKKKDGDKDDKKDAKDPKKGDKTDKPVGCRLPALEFGKVGWSDIVERMGPARAILRHVPNRLKRCGSSGSPW